MTRTSSFVLSSSVLAGTRSDSIDRPSVPRSLSTTAVGPGGTATSVDLTFVCPGSSGNWATTTTQSGAVTFGTVAPKGNFATTLATSFDSRKYFGSSARLTNGIDDSARIAR